MSDAYRAFIALPLPRKVIDHLSAVQHCLATGGIRARWVRPEGMHLTLKFIGHLVPEKIEAVHAVLDRAAAYHSPLQLTALGLGAFPNRRRPRVLWMGIGGETIRLGRLQHDIENGLSALGWPCEKRPFKGHLTLARARGRRPFESDIESLVVQCEPREPFGFVADKLILYSSRLRPEGAVYDKCHQRVLNRLTD
jgi:RNA 2',3'-cyclic 3'-phosphodiesterase